MISYGGFQANVVGTTVCIESVDLDLNDDCIVNLGDFEIFAAE